MATMEQKDNYFYAKKWAEELNIMWCGPEGPWLPPQYWEAIETRNRYRINADAAAMMDVEE